MLFSLPMMLIVPFHLPVFSSCGRNIVLLFNSLFHFVIQEYEDKMKEKGEAPVMFR